MKLNPVYKRESMVSSRSFRLPMVILMFNSILALVALLNMYSMLAQVRVTAAIQYSSFIDLYVFVAILEFVMLILIMPAITAGSISGERERQTLEMMLTTRMKPSQIVIGKLASAASIMLLLIISSFPILALVFVYGGVTVKDVIMLLGCFVTVALFIGSIGIFCSAMVQKTTTATVLTYIIVAALIGGTYAARYFADSLGEIQSGGLLGSSMVYLLLLNPSATFACMLRGIAGNETAAAVFTDWLERMPVNVITTHWMPISIAIQWGLSILMIAASIRQVDPIKRKRY